MAVDLVGIQIVEHLNRIFQPNNHDFSVSSNFNQAVSAFKRSGHARFRRGPPVSSSDPISCSVYSQSEDKLPEESPAASKENRSDAASFQSMTSSFAGGSLEGSVSNGRQLSSLGIVAPALSFSSRKPPLPSSHRKRHSGDGPSASVSRMACHCCKRRKSGTKHEVRRIPIIGSKIESIPADDYSWKKYGEKKVDGSPFPRVYYKCNSVKGCPAKKRVELALTDSKVLLVTYAGDHRHTPTPLPASLNSLQIQ
ncbi:hypothetical protein R6Q59_013192 [Mikania micrantha]